MRCPDLCLRNRRAFVESHAQTIASSPLRERIRTSKTTPSHCCVEFVGPRRGGRKAASTVPLSLAFAED